MSQQELSREIQEVSHINLPSLERKGQSLEQSLSPYIQRIKDLIYKSYRGVNGVESELIEDPEIFDYEQICFEIHVTGAPDLSASEQADQILEDEDKFYALFFEQIPKDKRHFFVFTYWVHE